MVLFIVYRRQVVKAGVLVLWAVSILNVLKKRLQVRLRKTFWMSLGLSAIFHVGLLVFMSRFNWLNGSIPEPEHVKFFSRHEPRLTKPFELRKLPQPKKWPVIHRERRRVSASLDQVPAVTAFTTRDHVSQLVIPNPPLTINPTDNRDVWATLEPEMLTGKNPIKITRQAEYQIDMNLEMLDINSMDTGRYRAIVIQNPGDPQAIKGFVKLGAVLSARTLYGTANLSSQGNFIREIDALVKTLNEYTGVRAEMVENLTFDDSRLLEVPILIVPYGTPNKNEISNLTQYVLEGGFIMGGIYRMEDKLFEGLEKHGKLVRGKDFYSEVLPDNHPVYSAFFDIHGGIGRRVLEKDDSAGGILVKEVESMVGYFVKGRMVGIDPIESFRWRSNDPRAARELMLAVNILIYALTQEGSITRHLMQQMK